MSYVYLHIKETTGEPFYVGKGKGSRAYSKKNRNNHWHNIVNKHGFDIIILEDDLTEDEAFKLEKEWIARIGRNDLKLGPLVNFTDGGEGRSGGVISDKQRAALNKSGNVTSEETKKKISKALKGRPSPMKGRVGSNKGKNLTDEVKKKISNSLKGRRVSKRTEFKKGGKSPTSIPVLNLETGVKYESITQAAKELGVKAATLTWQIKNNKHKNLVYGTRK